MGLKLFEAAAALLVTLQKKGRKRNARLIANSSAVTRTGVPQFQCSLVAAAGRQTPIKWLNRPADNAIKQLYTPIATLTTCLIAHIAHSCVHMTEKLAH